MNLRFAIYDLRLKKHAARWVLSLLPCLPVHPLQAQTNALPELVPAYPKLPSTFWQMHQASIIVIGFVLLAVTVLVLLAVMLREKQTVQPPEQIAREALDKLSGQSENGKVLSAVSQILRRYFGSIFEFRGEMTTAEFSVALAGHPNCDARFAAAVSSLLQACDKDKFSARTGAPPLNAVQRALQFIELVERSRRQPSAAGKPNP